MLIVTVNHAEYDLSVVYGFGLNNLDDGSFRREISASRSKSDHSGNGQLPIKVKRAGLLIRDEKHASPFINIGLRCNTAINNGWL